MNFSVQVADKSHIRYAKDISDEIFLSAQERHTGIARRTPEYLAEKILSGKSVIALDDDGGFAGFSYIESWEGKHYVANSGLIVAHKYRNMGLSRLIKEQTFILSRRLFPRAKIFSITTGGAVMRLNYEFGFRPVPFSELTKDPEFWKGCEGCRNYDILLRNNSERCICTGLLYDPDDRITIKTPDSK